MLNEINLDGRTGLRWNLIPKLKHCIALEISDRGAPHLQDRGRPARTEREARTLYVELGRMQERILVRGSSCCLVVRFVVKKNTQPGKYTNNHE